MRTLSRFLLLVFCNILLLVACKKNANPSQADYNAIVETQPPVLKAVTQKISDAIGGYYVSLPFYYDKTNKKYPLLVFLHGGGQVGNGQIDLPLLLNDGVAELVQDKKFPANFNVDGKNFSFITLTPQFNRYPSDADVKGFLDFARKSYRIDTARIYLSGLSMGGTVSANMGGEYTDQLAAIVPIAGVTTGSILQNTCNNIATGKLPVWVFHNTGDPSTSVSDPINFVSTINTFHPAIAPKLTLFNSNVHDAWTEAINPKYKENGMNMYEWMLHYTR
ncbi:MAG: hypothetical protein INR73_17840 [Williamsia sp.]|nr:hypothetical protein [Williamsia sp.]